jgi:CBS domain containing-hemolysin-like protein
MTHLACTSANRFCFHDSVAEAFAHRLAEPLRAMPVARRTPGRDARELEAGLHANDVAERVGVTLPPGRYETLGEFVMDRLGRIPPSATSLRRAATGTR